MKTFLKRIYKAIYLPAVFITAVSCVSTQNIRIEIPQKSQKELPAEIQSLTLVVRTVDERFTDTPADTIQKKFYQKRFNSDTVIYDIQAVDTALIALGELLFESGRYDFVIPENRFLQFEKNAFLSQEMPWDEAEMLCKQYQTDAVLSIEHFQTRVQASFDTESFYDPYSQSFNSAAVAEMQVSYEALFRVYYPAQKKILLREFVRDTIFWEDADISTRELFKRFTPVKTALTEAGIALALDFSEMISATWREEKRSFFVKGNKDIRNAGVFAVSGDFDNAKAIWQRIEETAKSKTLKSKVQYNLALASEINGDLKSAVEWALKSYENMYRQITYQYLEILKKRNRELKTQKK